VSLAAKPETHRPGIAPALGLRAEDDGLSTVAQASPTMESCTMASPFSPRRRSRPPIHRRSRTVRPELQRLEERSLLSGYQQINLVGYQPGMGHFTDPNLNGWGMVSMPDGSFCVANTLSTGLATFYDRSGHVLPLTIIVPASASQPLGPVGHPTGVVYNPTSDFVIVANGKSAPARLIFDTLDGTISGWNPDVDPTHAIRMVDNDAAGHPAVYTGLDIAQNSRGQNVLYAADILNDRVEMLDDGFQAFGSFTDPSATGFGAWQVEDVNGQLFVTFGTFAPPFGGVVDVFDTDGNLLTPNHFAANAAGVGPLENPWAIVQAPANFGAFSNDLLIGNVEGAGNINAFDAATGAYLGQLRHPDGTPIAIAGLWDLVSGTGTPDSGATNRLFFDAGPNGPNPTGNGLVGVIHAVGDQGKGQSTSQHGAGGSAVTSTIAGQAPLRPPAATGPEAMVYGWLIDIAPTSGGVFTTLIHQGKSNKANGEAALET
jgi:uncharacterized protein (TIGR03118 family)